jgi:protein-tyrosine-phosphatase
MNPRVFNVLFLCTGNSARSIMAECATNRWGRETFKGFGGGSHPLVEIHPLTLRVLKELDYDTSGLRSKSWDEFAGRTARSSISCSLSATTLLVRYVRYGPESR